MLREDDCLGQKGVSFGWPFDCLDSGMLDVIQEVVTTGDPQAAERPLEFCHVLVRRHCKKGKLRNAHRTGEAKLQRSYATIVHD
jgi:hypothetical protein